MKVFGLPIEGPMSAKQVRKIADDFNVGTGYNIYEEDGDGGVSLCAVKTENCQRALRQGADVIERLAKIEKLVEDTRKKLSCDACKARCRRENEIPECEAGRNCEVIVYDKILRIAKGEKK